jgi:hypothetical protein
MAVLLRCMIRFVKWIRFHIDTPGIFGNFSFGISANDGVER